MVPLGCSCSSRTPCRPCRVRSPWDPKTTAAANANLVPGTGSPRAAAMARRAASETTVKRPEVNSWEPTVGPKMLGNQLLTHNCYILTNIDYGPWMCFCCNQLKLRFDMTTI